MDQMAANPPGAGHHKHNFLQVKREFGLPGEREEEMTKLANPSFILVEKWSPSSLSCVLTCEGQVQSVKPDGGFSGFSSVRRPRQPLGEIRSVRVNKAQKTASQRRP